MTICAARFGSIHRGRTRSRPLRSAHSCTARPALLPSLNICRVCAACDRSRLLLLLGSQDRRASTARRCGLLLYTGRYHAERLGSSGASADRRAASIPSSCCGTAVATVWLRYLVARVLCVVVWPPQAIRSRVVCVGRGPGAQGRCPQCMGCLGRVVQASVVCYSGAIALVRSSVRNLGVQGCNYSPIPVPNMRC